MRLALSTGLTLLLLSAMPMNAVASEQRLGEGHNRGRCLLIVDGKTLISGKCGYRITKGGEFYIAGPRQVYEGLDYPRCPAPGESASGCGAMQQSNDYWARVWKEPDGTWTGYGNADIRATHGSIVYRTLARQGACYVGEADPGRMTDDGVYMGVPVKICLWRQ
ncbi:MAG: hypothetical protein KA105_09955 [Caulobacter sp.]|nr:hypothetical protein [Caulobacter sp.]